MEWNVLCEDVNGRKLNTYNIFQHSDFADGVNQLLKENFTKKEFSEKLRISLMYYFWSKCEWEITITSWPPYINKEELNRVNTEYEEFSNKYGYYPYRINVGLEVEEKIDVFQQVDLNWNVFVDYVWSHKTKLLKNKENKNYD